MGNGTVTGALWSGRALRRLNFKKMSSAIPQQVSEALLQRSEPVPDEAVSVQGPNFDEHPTLQSLLQSYERIGFQANSLGKAIKIVDKMVGAPLSVDKIKLVTSTSSLVSVVGASPTNPSPKMKQTNSPIPTSAPERAVTSFSATLRISYLLASVKSFYTS